MQASTKFLYTQNYQSNPKNKDIVRDPRLLNAEFNSINLILYSAKLQIKNLPQRDLVCTNAISSHPHNSTGKSQKDFKKNFNREKKSL